MATINISLPEALMAFVDERAGACGYGTRDEYVQELIVRDQDRVRLRRLLLTGAESASAAPANAGYFNRLRERVR